MRPVGHRGIVGSETAARRRNVPHHCRGDRSRIKHELHASHDRRNADEQAGDEVRAKDEFDVGKRQRQRSDDDGGEQPEAGDRCRKFGGVTDFQDGGRNEQAADCEAGANTATFVTPFVVPISAPRRTWADESDAPGAPRGVRWAGCCRAGGGGGGRGAERDRGLIPGRGIARRREPEGHRRAVRDLLLMLALPAAVSRCSGSRRRACEPLSDGTAIVRTEAAPGMLPPAIRRYRLLPAVQFATGPESTPSSTPRPSRGACARRTSPARFLPACPSRDA